MPRGSGCNFSSCDCPLPSRALSLAASVGSPPGLEMVLRDPITVRRSRSSEPCVSLPLPRGQGTYGGVGLWIPFGIHGFRGGLDASILRLWVGVPPDFRWMPSVTHRPGYFLLMGNLSGLPALMHDDVALALGLKPFHPVQPSGRAHCQPRGRGDHPEVGGRAAAVQRSPGGSRAGWQWALQCR